MNSKNLIKNQSSSIKQSFLAIALKKLTKKERQVLIFISSAMVKKNATQIAKDISLSLNCAESSAWSILKSLREMKLIEYDKNGSELQLSKSAKILIGGMTK